MGGGGLPHGNFSHISPFFSDNVKRGGDHKNPKKTFKNFDDQKFFSCNNEMSRIAEMQRKFCFKILSVPSPVVWLVRTKSK